MLQISDGSWLTCLATPDASHQRRPEITRCTYSGLLQWITVELLCKCPAVKLHYVRLSLTACCRLFRMRSSLSAFADAQHNEALVSQCWRNPVKLPSNMTHFKLRCMFAARWTALASENYDG
jgi:hypothetical protein